MIGTVQVSHAGTLLWGMRAGGSANDEGLALAMDGGGTLFVTGTFGSASNATFGSHVLMGAGSSDVFVACIEATASMEVSTIRPSN